MARDIALSFSALSFAWYAAARSVGVFAFGCFRADCLGGEIGLGGEVGIAPDSAWLLGTAATLRRVFG